VAPVPEVDEMRRIYRAHVASVYAFFAYSVSRDVAEDLTSATFERVVRSWHRYDPSMGTERTWILSIARNLLADHFRRQRHRRHASIEEHPALVDNLRHVEDPLSRELSTSGIVDLLRSLSPREQEVLALRFGADLSAREVATTLGISEDNVHQIASRGLRKLRALTPGAEY
jgi:RNA polymerase sigma-70 factor (ECF subfamily)